MPVTGKQEVKLKQVESTRQTMLWYKVAVCMVKNEENMLIKRRQVTDTRKTIYCDILTNCADDRLPDSNRTKDTSKTIHSNILTSCADDS